MQLCILALHDVPAPVQVRTRVRAFWCLRALSDPGPHGCAVKVIHHTHLCVCVCVSCRRGERGEGVSTRPDRVQELFTALARVPTLLAAAAQAGSQANPAADTMNEDTDRVSHNKGPKGLTMNISLDIDVPR